METITKRIAEDLARAAEEEKAGRLTAAKIWRDSAAKWTKRLSEEG